MSSRTIKPRGNKKEIPQLDNLFWFIQFNDSSKSDLIFKKIHKARTVYARYAQHCECSLVPKLGLNHLT